MLCDNPERGDGVWGWEEGSRVRGHMYTYGRPTLLYGRTLTFGNLILKSNYPPIKKKLSDSLPKMYIQCVSMKYRRLELERVHVLINKSWSRVAGDVAKGQNLV